MRPRVLLAIVLGCGFGVSGSARAGPDHEAGPAPAAPERVALEANRYALRVTDNNLMGITITNYGFVGNNFVSRAPSLEYPLGAGFEHLVRGGLWVGAYAYPWFTDTVHTDRFYGVVTGALDGSQGGGSQSATEFSPVGTEIAVHSKLPNSKYYSPQAVSELDLVAEYSDTTAKRAANNAEDHWPIGLLVRQENYMWSFSDFQHFVIFHYTIKNLGPPLSDAWIGLYAEFASGDKNAYSVWPPSSSASSLGSWYLKKLLAYDPAENLFREHFCAARPAAADTALQSCRFAVAPYWIGLRLLGVRPGNLADTSDTKISLAAWNWAPGSTARDEDVERYALMSTGRIQPLVGDSLLPESGDPVELLAVGPFREIDPGDSVTVDFAIVGGAEIEDVRRHSKVAQLAFDNDYIVPVPPPSPRFHVVPHDQSLDFYWDKSPEDFEDPTSLPTAKDFEGYRLYLGEDRLDLKRIAQFDLETPPNDTTGFNTGFGAIRLQTAVVIEGDTCQYRHTVRALRNGFKYFCAVTSYDQGTRDIESLESGISQNKLLAIPSPGKDEYTRDKPTVFPNPYRVEARWDQGQKVRDHYVWFANLPERCGIKIFTLSGDLVFETEFDGATYHGEGARGIYDPRRELDVSPPTLSGRMYGWDLISREGQAVASGLYLFTVEDRGSGRRTVGKLLIVKSDREEF